MNDEAKKGALALVDGILNKLRRHTCKEPRIKSTSITWTVAPRIDPVTKIEVGHVLMPNVTVEFFEELPR